MSHNEKPVCVRIMSDSRDIERDRKRPTREEAKEAVRTLIAWSGADPERSGLLETPDRVVDAYTEFFSGYNDCPRGYLSKTFETGLPYDGIVLLRGVEIHSHCEHHMLPFMGKVHIAYYPVNRVVGLSKLVRTIEIFSRRLQTQEMMTSEIAHAIQDVLQPEGVAVMVEAVHLCMVLRGIKKSDVNTITTQFLGRFESVPEQERFISLIKM